MARRRDVDILNLINSIMHRASAQMQQSLRDDDAGITAMDARALSFVARHPACTQSDIVRESGRDKAQIARLIRDLLESGLLRRLPDEAGQKKLRLALTARGENLHRKAESRRTEIAGRLFKPLSVDERKNLESMLQRIAQAILPHAS